MSARRAGKLSGSFAVVADVITVPKGCETAIETALGASVQDIITDSVEDAKRAIEFLKDKRAGRATFLPLESMRASGSDLRGEMNGAVGIAADLIDYDTQYDPAIRPLLGRTVVADDIDAAHALSRRLSGWNKIVTLEGEMIVPSGAITGGARKSRGPDLLSRKQEIDSLTGEVTKLKAAAANFAGDTGDRAVEGNGPGDRDQGCRAISLRGTHRPG